MQRRDFLRALAAAPLLSAQTRKPNVIVILADDVGYGDLSCYGATRVRTPNLDKLASRGIRFTDAHAAAATCTPTRYSLLSGEYAWRKKGTNILPGDAALIIDTDRPSLASVMKGAGYTTGVVGKWHLGLGPGPGKTDWNTEITPGPREIGFDYSFLIPATGDRVPTVFVENQRVVALDPKDPIAVNYKDKIGDLPTGKERPDLLKVKLTHGHDMTIINGISRIGYMSGGKSAWWKDEDIADTITKKATDWIQANRSKPFFLYFATHDIHVPRVPHSRFKGKTECGTRCEAIASLDASVGRIMDTLDRLKLANNTLLIFSSDNGPVLDDGYADGAVEDLNGHTPSGKLKGGKYSPYEGGTRMPFILRWPARVKPGTSGALVCQVDLMASLAALAGTPLPQNAGPDSFNVLPALLGQSKTGRDHLVEQANRLALRKGSWKYVAPLPNKAGEELYNLSADPGEGKDLAAEKPEVVAEMRAMLEKIHSAGRSRS